MEIFQNTLLQLIIRQGLDSDRKRIVLKSGELGFTTDTERLFVGNGSLSGGTVAGNLFKGSAPDITTLAPCVIGDYVFDSDKNKLYRLNQNDGSNLSDWQLIGGIYTAGDSYLSFSSDNEITLNALSAFSISQDALDSPLSLSAGRIHLNPLSAGHVSHDVVASPLYVEDGRIKLDNIDIANVSTNTLTVTGGLIMVANGVPATGTAVNPLSTNIYIESNQLYAKYNGLSSTTEYLKNITTVNKLSAGYYRFNYLNLPTSNLIPTVQLYGDDFWDYKIRTVNSNLSSTDVKVLNGSDVMADAIVTLLINY